MTDFLFCIVSARRAARVRAMMEFVALAPHVWFVPDGEREAYMKMGAADVVEAGNTLCSQRTAALRYAWGKKKICVQLSDDLTKLELACSKTHAVPITVGTAATLIHQAMKAVGCKLGGVAPTSNKFYFNPNQPLNTRAFCVADFLVVEDCDLYFDPNIRIKDDYDYTMQHIQKFGAVARHNGILASFKHYTNEGGVTTYRTPEVELADVAYLKAKWPGAFRDNPKRPREILMNR